MYKNYLFDLDGTLLPMDMEEFIKLYFGSLCKRFSPVLNIEPDKLINAVWKGTGAMAENDNSATNREVFWAVASKACGMDLSRYESDFDDYYSNEFIAAKQATNATPFAKKSIDYIKRNGGRLIAATNPIFPKVATERRLRWARLSPDDFELITVYENSGFCKPNLKYFEMICEKCGIKPEESIMVGNDVDEDLCSAQLGFDTYLITDCVINRENKDYSAYNNGSFESFYNDFLRC
ncbi:MAG: HAD family hydrolase [Clostridiales bacterium]|nr:HAD family hydrolase [Clostridiales bacterium]